MKILYFSTVNWNWIKQRPHFISYYLSKNNYEVDYFSMTPFLKQKITKFETDSKNLNIKDTYVIPFSNKSKFIEGINKKYVEILLRKNKYDVIILTHPFQLKYVKKNLRSKCKLIYECMDNMPYFYDNPLRNKVKHHEKELCLLVDNIITSSNYLKGRLINDYKINKEKIFVIQNAVDYSIIEQEVTDIGISHPNIMYIGTIDEWLDIDTLNEFSANNSEYTIYLVGPVKKEIKQKLKYNIKLIGSIPHEMVKSYILNGDVMIIPFKTNELIYGVDPVKMYEYLTFNKPVVTSYWDELEKYCSNKLVYFYNNYDEFNEKINFEKKYSDTYINMNFIVENNWETRIKMYVSILNSI